LAKWGGSPNGPCQQTEPASILDFGIELDCITTDLGISFSFADWVYVVG
jgi:hypothetical protein